jgi:hypothetical protein
MDLLGTTRSESEEALMNEAGSSQLNDRKKKQSQMTLSFLQL